MVKIEFRKVGKAFGKKNRKKDVISDMSFEVSHGDMYGIIGASGAGKTTVLRMIAGLEEPTSGSILFDNKVVAENGRILVPAEERNIGMVFQNWALYPHMSNFENIAFPLRAKRVPNDKIREKVEYLANLLDITETLRRRPGLISGGQQQRVAVCRALSKDPSLLLLDEPFSNLDATIKDSARSLVRTVQSELGITAIIVSHDPADIFALASNTLCITGGKSGQAGKTSDLYHAPNSIDVARSIGEINLLRATVEVRNGRDAAVLGEENILPVTLSQAARSSLDSGDRSLIVGIRPEDIRIVEDSQEQVDARRWLAAGNATVKISSYSAGIFRILLRLHGVETDLATTSEHFLPPGQEVSMFFRKDDVKLFDNSGYNLAATPAAAAVPHQA